MNIEQVKRKLKKILKNRIEDVDNYFLQIALLMDYIDDYYRAKQEIEKNGLVFTNKYGIVQKNPAVAIQQHSAKAIRQLMNELKLTPKTDEIDSIDANDFIESLCR